MARRYRDKVYNVTYRSKYYPLDTRKRKVTAPSKKWVRENWYGIMMTDEFKVVKVEEADE